MMNKNRPFKTRWADAAQACEHRGEAYALITVLGCSGSTPRDNSSKMVVTADASYDTIGGGNLEFVVTNTAREYLATQQQKQEIIPFPLGGALGQCCGGNATVLIETFAACDFRIALFGAGHVAKELVKILASLPCKVDWIDSREALFPETLGDNINATVSQDPVSLVAGLADNTDVLILTHDHQLDYQLSQAAMRHGKLRHIGLIGSDTKAARFRQRFIKDGFSLDQIAQINCPVGLDQVGGKLPMEVAVSIAAQLIAIENQDKPHTQHRGLKWRDIKHALTPASLASDTDDTDTNTSKREQQIT